MKKHLSLCGLAIIVLLTAATTNAAPQVFTATLTGAQENPATGSPGIGSALVTLDTVTNMITISVSFSGLTGTTTASHIHCCAPVGVNVGVATTTPFFPGFPLGVTSGTYLQTFDLTLAPTYNPAFVVANGGTVAGARAALIAGLIGGQTYLNIHTNIFPGGEIRGQLLAAACSYKILVVYADTGTPTTLPAQLLAETNVGAVDLFNGDTGTPTLAQLQAYDVVVPWSNTGWADQTTLGNNLDSYLAGNGIVVGFNFDWGEVLHLFWANG